MKRKKTLMTRTKTELFLLVLSLIFIVLMVFAIVFAKDAWSILRNTMSIPSEAVFELTIGVVFFFFAGILLFMGLFALVLIPKKTVSGVPLPANDAKPSV
jgi:hypothetical protein